MNIFKWFRNYAWNKTTPLEPVAYVQESVEAYEISPKGLDALMHEEGFIRELYKDSRGYFTIGVGHLLTDAEKKSGKIVLSSGEQVSIHTQWTRKQVKQLLRDDLVRFHQVVNELSEFLTQGQFDALVSFAFNIGVTGFRNSTAARYVRERKHTEVPTAMLMWDKPPEIKGRRAREAQMYLDSTNSVNLI